MVLITTGSNNSGLRCKLSSVFFGWHIKSEVKRAAGVEKHQNLLRGLRTEISAKQDTNERAQSAEAAEEKEVE